MKLLSVRLVFAGQPGAASGDTVAVLPEGTLKRRGNEFNSWAVMAIGDLQKGDTLAI